MTVITGGLITLEYATSGVQFLSVGQAQNAARDADITTYVQAATPVIENIAGACLSASKTILFNGGVPYILLNNRIQSITTVVESGTTLNPATDYYLDTTANVLYRGVPPFPTAFFAPGMANISVTYLAGYAVVPFNVQLATRELVRFWWQQGMQANRPGFGDPGADVSFTPQGFAVPKRVIELLAPERAQLGGFA